MNKMIGVGVLLVFMGAVQGAYINPSRAQLVKLSSAVSDELQRIKAPELVCTKDTLGAAGYSAAVMHAEGKADGKNVNTTDDGIF